MFCEHNEVLIEILKELLKRNIPIELSIYPGTSRFFFKVMGFYKSGSIKLELEDDLLIFTDRYNGRHAITNWEDMVILNFDWWQRSCQRFEGWKQPDKAFVEDFLRLGLIEKITTVEYKMF